MKQLLLVRYGQHDLSGHINDAGRMSMQVAAGKIAEHVKTNSTLIVAANVSRAIESAEVVANALAITGVVVVDELYAAAEDERLPDCSVAYSKLLQVVGSFEVVVAVVSREYIESLPSYMADHVFGGVELAPLSLDRGEALVIDLEAKQIYPLRTQI